MITSVRGTGRRKQYGLRCLMIHDGPHSTPEAPALQVRYEITNFG